MGPPLGGPYALYPYVTSYKIAKTCHQVPNYHGSEAFPSQLFVISKHLYRHISSPHFKIFSFDTFHIFLIPVPLSKFISKYIATFFRNLTQLVASVRYLSRISLNSYLINLAKQGYCNHFVCLSVCLSVCLFVCLFSVCPQC